MKHRYFLPAALSLSAISCFFLFRPETQPQGQNIQDPPSIYRSGGMAKPTEVSIDEAAFAAVDRYLKTSQFDSEQSLTDDVVAAFTNRYADMKRLMRVDPKTALENAIGYSEYDALPERLKAYVETPFSTQGDLRVFPDCGFERNGRPQFQLTTAAGEVVYSVAAQRNRSLLSKDDIPVQGIQIDDLGAFRQDALHILESNDVEFVQRSYPLANPNPNLSFSEGQTLPQNPIVALSGGKRFLFATKEEALALNESLAQIDALPGQKASSRVILTKLAYKAESGFPIQEQIESLVTISFSSTTGQKKVLAILVDFSDIPGEHTFAANLKAKIDNGSSDALDRYSHGATSVIGTVTTTTYRLDDPSTAYASETQTKTLSDMIDEAKAKYVADGNPDPTPLFDTIGVVFPKIPFSFAGLATLGGSEYWMNGDPSIETLVHEFGHNYGLSHANYWVFDRNNVVSTNPTDPSGENEEYGDNYDVMGGGSVFQNEGFFHAAAADLLNWTAANQVDELTGPLDNDTYRVYRFDHRNAKDDLLALRIRKANSENYWVSYRKGFTKNQALSNSTYVQWEREANTSPNQGHLIDMTPGSDAGKLDAGLSLGRTYSDSAADVHITPIATGGNSPEEYIDVVVNFGPFNGNQSPSVSLESLGTVDARTSINLSATGNDPDGDSIAYSWDFGDGSSSGSSSEISHQWISGGTFEVSVTASDMKGGTASASASITVNDPLNSWTTRSAPVANYATIASNDSIAIASGNVGTTVTSTDGITWTERALSLNANFNSIIWTGTKFYGAGQDVISGQFGGMIYSSPDGIAWTQEYIDSENRTELEAIAFNPNDGTIVAGGRLARVLTSSGDGSWTKQTDFIDPTKRISALAWVGDRFIAAAHSFSFNAGDFSGEPELFKSADGISWESIPLSSAEFSTFEVFGGDIRGLVLNNGQLYSTGFASGLKLFNASSERFINSSISETQYTTNALGVGNGIFYALGEDNDNGRAQIDFVSLDGVLWLPIAPSSATERTSITFFKDTFIVVGDNGLIQQSGVVNQSAFAAWFNSILPGEPKAGANDNPDNDWANNLLEYALGGDPSDSSNFPAIPQFLLDQSDKTLSVSISREQDRDDISIIVEVSSDLENWSTLSTTTVTDTASALEFLSGVQDLDQDLFYRIKVDLSQ